MRLWLSLLLLLATPAVAQDKPMNWGLQVDDPVVKEACGECHMAFAPVFLPARSWKAVMAGLSDHYGSGDATLDAETTRRVTDYLVSRAGDSFAKGYGSISMDGLSRDKTPTRLTEVPAWKANHYNGVFPEELRAEVATWLNCPACHKWAEEGDYTSW